MVEDVVYRDPGYPDSREDDAEIQEECEHTHSIAASRYFSINLPSFILLIFRYINEIFFYQTEKPALTIRSEPENENSRTHGYSWEAIKIYYRGLLDIHVDDEVTEELAGDVREGNEDGHDEFEFEKCVPLPRRPHVVDDLPEAEELEVPDAEAVDDLRVL